MTASRDDEDLLHLFNQIKAFSALPDSSPPQAMPTGLNGFQRAMCYQYCEELAVHVRISWGLNPHHCISWGLNPHHCISWGLKRV